MQNPSETRSGNKIPLWNILNLLNWTTSYFKSHNIESPRASAEILLAHALGLRRIDLYLQYDQPLSKDELAIFKSLIKRRVKQEPVAYIVGCREFWSLELKVTKDVLIPRPETERLIETALGHLSSGIDHLSSGICESSNPLQITNDKSQMTNPKSQMTNPKRILEIGTGSGAIILALASERHEHLFFASDRSVTAIEVAKENARRHHMETSVHFFCGDWFTPLGKTILPFDMILSNPPYIRTCDMDNLQPEIRKYEPITALDGGRDGLASVRHIICTAHNYLARQGILMLEIGHDQKDEVLKTAEQCGHYKDIDFIKDYSGYDRIVQMRS